MASIALPIPFVSLSSLLLSPPHFLNIFCLIACLFCTHGPSEEQEIVKPGFKITLISSWKCFFLRLNCIVLSNLQGISSILGNQRTAKLGVLLGHWKQGRISIGSSGFAEPSSELSLNPQALTLFPNDGHLLFSSLYAPLRNGDGDGDRDTNCLK